MRPVTFFMALTMVIVMAMGLAAPPTSPTSPITDISVAPVDELTNITTAGPGDDIAHGRCSFHVKVHQFCDWGTIRTRISIPKLMDKDHKTILQPRPDPRNPNNEGEWKDLTPKRKDSVWHFQPGRGMWDIWVSYWDKPGRLVWSYGSCKRSTDKKTDPGRNCGDCRVGDWTRSGMECRIDWEKDRRQDMDCSFAC